MIYLDYAASAPVRPEVWAAMQPWLGEHAGNPASAHSAGRRARRALEDSREQIAGLLGAFPDEVIFTSGATEANNLATFGLAGDLPGHFLASAIEHPCVVEPMRQLTARGFDVEWLPVDSGGLLQSEVLAERVRPETRLVAVMLANHETGAVQDIPSLRGRAGESHFHCDAAQAVGKLRVDFHELGATTLSVSAHKFGGPPGIGALLLNRCSKIRPLMYGGHQQHGRRPGTEPVALAVGFAAALDSSLQVLDTETARMRDLRNRFLASLQRDAAPVVVNGPDRGGLPNILNVSFPGCRSDALLMALDLAGVMCSTGSACSSGSLLPSPVLIAMGISEARLHSAMRFSFGAGLEVADIEDAVKRVSQVVARLRATPEDCASTRLHSVP